MLRKGGDGVSSRGLLDRLLEPVGDHAVTLGGRALVVQSHRRGGVPEAVLHLADGGARLGAEGRPDAERQAAMDAVNPRYVLRNWIAEAAIRAARAGDFSEVEAVLDCLSRPFTLQPAHERFAAPPPDWAAGLAVSCSS